MKNTTKRALYIIAALLAALFVLACLAGFAACGGGGSNDDDTETVVPDAGDEGEHTHTYSSAVTKSATCTEKGERTYTCSCGASYTEEIDINPDNHDYVPTAVEATCSSSGYTTYKCSRCGYSYTATGEPATGNHAWDGGVTTATCEAAGMTIYTCTLCGATKFEAATALGHDMDDGVVTTEATCTADGVKTYSCSRCDYTETETIEALGHDLQISETDATCTSGGSVTETCTRCNYMSYYLTDALGHDLVGTYCSATQTWSYSCTRCEQTVTIEDSSLITDATLTATDKASLQSAVKWNAAQGASLTVKLDSSTYVCSGECCGEECGCECCDGCCEDGECSGCAECGVPTIDMSDPSDFADVSSTALPQDDSNADAVIVGTDLTDCEETNEANAVKLTLDLNGNTLVRNKPNNSGWSYDTIVVHATGDLTIIDSAGGGVVDAIGNGNRAVVNYGTLTLAGGFFTRSNEKGMDETSNGTDSSYTIDNYGYMTIEDGATVYNAGDYSTCIRSHTYTGSYSYNPTSVGDHATLTMTGGKVYGGKYAVGNGTSGYDDEFIMTGGTLGGLRGDDDTLPYRALNNYCNATITGGTLLGGNGGSITASPTKADECVEGVVIFNEDTGEQALTIGNEDGSGPDIIYEGVNAGTTLRGDFATGIALFSGEVDFLGGTVKCIGAEPRPFVGAYLIDGTFNMFGGTISGIEAAIAVNAAAGSKPQVNIFGGVLEGAEIIHTVTAEDREYVVDRVSVPSSNFTFNSETFNGLSGADNFSANLNGESESTTFDGIVVTSVIDENGTVNVVVDGVVANVMSDEQKAAFSSEFGDDDSRLRFYVAVQIVVHPGETITWTIGSGDDEKTGSYTNDGTTDYYDIWIIDVNNGNDTETGFSADSGAAPSGDYGVLTSGGASYSFTISSTNADGTQTSVSYVVSFDHILIPQSAWQTTGNGGD